ncbi:MAG TPA: class I SAM-dependent methyltransferase [Pyrinomonadaceae bacterium]|nr:class I SAM-dependent methyltransferase [Pyrinomonadaceae bacterium]
MPVRAAQHLLFLAQSERDTLDRWGYHIRPIHYYEPLPDFRAITKDKLDRRREYPAVNLNWQAQSDLLRELGSCYRGELIELSNRFDFANGFFGGYDAAAYYALIRHLKPHCVVEVGGGYSTAIAERAIQRNRIEGRDGCLKCIEPNPEPRLTDSITETELIKSSVQDTAIEFFADLEANDILFIDSSHTVKFGSDVCYLFLEVLPSLKPGVWVHVHDIFFPNDYPAEWLLEKRLALNEQYLLEAFLAFNSSVSICLSNHWLALDHPDEVAGLWPPGSSDQPSSFWFKRVHE